MTNSFEIALSNTEFFDIKEKDLSTHLIDADELCSYINKFLPRQLTSYGEESENSDSENNEEEEENKKSMQTAPFGNTSRAKTIEELHNRIEKLRGKKVNYKEKLLKKGLKNRLKKKQKLEERKQLKNAARKQESIKTDGIDDNKNKMDEMASDKKPKLNQQNSLQFNKITISSSENVTSTKTNDPKRILQQIEKKNEKLKKLELKGKQEKVREIKVNQAWEVAIKKAEGIKVKDNVELLKKTISKKRQQKQISKKKWEEREKFVQSKKEEVQKKRQDNILKKKKERSKKRTKMLVKKGRILPK